MTEKSIAFLDPSTDPDAVEMPEAFRWVMFMDSLKEVARQNPLASGERKERVAEHSWHLAAAVILLRDLASEEVNTDHAVSLAVAHDIVECLAGDTFAFGDDVEDQYAREHSAMKLLRDLTSDSAVHRLLDYWEEYEDQATAEAKFVKGLDAVLPIALNFHNPAHSSWQSHDVPAAKVRTRLRTHGDPGNDLRALANVMIDRAEARGQLK